MSVKKLQQTITSSVDYDMGLVEFCINLIQDAYKTNDPHIIKSKIAEELDEDYPLVLIAGYLNIRHVDYEKEDRLVKYTLNSRQLFYD